MVGALSMLLAVLLAIAFTAAGSAKVQANKAARKTAASVGYVGTDYWKFEAIGGAELLGAAGVLVGLWAPLIWIGYLAGLGLLILMVLAVRRHMGRGHHRNEWIPAATMGVMAVSYLLTRIAS